ncbi:hypothetical protein HNY73_003846 [Argiope bruennichi]|uniref:Uncharacterized protein n=2 Tax=Argiope bruennichi TaxID=94029 RepID=A0A8T0FRU2_ARGBR|nr:hypothetical protein HNY73_003846 [Argiope bruennichi]
MYTCFEKIKCCLVKILLISNAFLWILCESRQLLGIGTRLASSDDGEYIHTYSSWKTAGVNAGNNNMDNDFRPGNHFIPFQIWVTIMISLFVFILMLCYCCIAWEMRRRRLWSNVDVNPSQTVGPWSNMTPYPSQPAGQLEKE